jgi:hypothetical protein
MATTSSKREAILVIVSMLTNSELCAIGMAATQGYNASRFLGHHMQELDIAVDFPLFLFVSIHIGNRKTQPSN